MTKIILSRKGFDSGSGGYPSPILPDGTMISFPIPDDKADVYYKDLRCNGLPYLELMKQLGIKKFDANSRVHLDPDIKCSVMERKGQKWQAIFGQCDASSTHLNNSNVEKGDIFLFFGWFRKTIKTSTGYKYDPADKDGKHVLWGYMEIGEIIKIDKNADYPEHYLLHPHFEGRDRKNNTAYLATDKLSFNPDIAGAGVFKFDERLVLSCEDDKKAVWKLPKFFHPDCGTKMTYHVDLNRWEKKDGCCLLQSVGRGQEFVISESFDVKQWAKNIILSNVNEKFQHV